MSDQEHIKRAFVFGGMKALKDLGLLYKDASDGMVKLSQEYGFDPYDLFGYGNGQYGNDQDGYDQYGIDPYSMMGGGGGGYGGDQMPQQPPQQPPQGPGMSPQAGGAMGGAAGGILGAGLGGMGGYYGADAINELFGTDVDPKTLAAALGLVGGSLGGAGGGYMGAKYGPGLMGGEAPQG